MVVRMMIFRIIEVRFFVAIAVREYRDCAKQQNGVRHLQRQPTFLQRAFLATTYTDLDTFNIKKAITFAS
jgi:hypothetical protein